MIGAVAEKSAVCICNSAVEIQVSKRADVRTLDVLMQMWTEIHGACYENETNLKHKKA